MADGIKQLSGLGRLWNLSVQKALLTVGGTEQRSGATGLVPSPAHPSARVMPLTTLAYSTGDPGCLVSACQQALERLVLVSRGQPVPRCWIDYPYTEEELTLLEEEVLPAMQLFLERVGEIDARLEAEQAG